MYAQNLCESLNGDRKEDSSKSVSATMELYELFLQGTFHLEGFFIDGQSLPQVAPTGDYKLELVITRKIDGKQTPVFSMVWFATLALKDA